MAGEFATCFPKDFSEGKAETVPLPEIGSASLNHNRIALSSWPIAALFLSVTKSVGLRRGFGFLLGFRLTGQFNDSSGLTDGCAVGVCSGDVWRCWNLPPVPLQRMWALAFGGISAGMIYQFWRAEAWKSETEKLQLELQGQRLLLRPLSLF